VYGHLIVCGILPPGVKKADKVPTAQNFGNNNNNNSKKKDGKGGFRRNRLTAPNHHHTNSTTASHGNPFDSGSTSGGWGAGGHRHPLLHLIRERHRKLGGALVVAASANHDDDDDDDDDDDRSSTDDDDDDINESEVAKKEFLQPFVFTAHAKTKPPVFLQPTDAPSSELPSLPVNAVSGELKDDEVAMHVARWSWIIDTWFFFLIVFVYPLTPVIYPVFHYPLDLFYHTLH